MTRMYAVLEQLGWTVVVLLYLGVWLAAAWALLFALAWLAGGARRALCRRFRP
ncbi:MAG TPA: hypothetical protein VEQ60_31965 [Longimicrobium sp.]|nr:hypothetical protein [Longimicrobium sp.]